MVEIRDNVTGETIIVGDMDRALQIAEDRIERHNSYFSYRHRGAHYPVGARMDIQVNIVYIHSED